MMMSTQLVAFSWAMAAFGTATMTAALASAFGRDGFAWFMIGLIFGPFGLAAVAMMGRPPARPALRNHVRQCPACRFDVPEEATRCGHCTSDIPPQV